MAITRRQFITTLGALAAAMGVGEADITKITEAFAHGSVWTGNWTDKPKVIWVHGAECTGCSTSLLSFFEDVTGKAIAGASTTTLAALDLAVGGTGGDTRVTSYTADPTGHPFAHRTLHNSKTVTGCDFDSDANSNTLAAANIADVLIDFIDLQYHETVMGMGGDLAYQWLADNMYNGSSAAFVLVVEGAVQAKDNQGYWDSAYTEGTTAPWCAIGMDDSPDADYTGSAGKVIGNTGGNNGEHSFDDVVKNLAVQPNCAAVVAVGQCATYGGYPACVSPVLKEGMTGAQGVSDFLKTHGATAAAGKVINVPGCPSNPWWMVLTIVAWLVDFVNPNTLGILDSSHNIIPSAVDRGGRLKAVFNTSVHGPACPRYQDFLNGNFATLPGQTGCLQLIGCKGPSTKALCNVHGWNSLQPNNNSAWENGLNTISGARGSACIMAGHPCMGCTEKGYPDSFVPYVVR